MPAYRLEVILLSGYEYPYNGGPYGGGYYYTPKDTLPQRIKRFFSENGALEVIAVSSIIGAAPILYFILRRLYASFFLGIPQIAHLYQTNFIGSKIIEMFYTLLCVALPFAVAYFFLRRSGQLKKPLPFGRTYKNSCAFILILSGIAVCFIGNMITNLLAAYASAVGIEFNSYSAAVAEKVMLPENAVEYIFMALHTAVMPAVFEEFAFRGVVMQPLRKYGDWFAIIMSAVLFGLIHGNMTQMPFALIAGIALGYISTVTGSLWTGVVLHFLNNFISLNVSLVRTAVSESTYMIFSSVTIYGLIIIGVLCFAVYSVTHPKFYRLYPRENKALKTRRITAVFLFTPVMLVSLIMLIVPLFGDITYRG